METSITVEADGQLAALVEQALSGHDVTITRGGRPVAQLRPLTASRLARRKSMRADLAWLDAHRVPSAARQDAGTLLSDMRDEDNAR